LKIERKTHDLDLKLLLLVCQWDQELPIIYLLGYWRFREKYLHQANGFYLWK
jgi:hypothetical protein